MPPYFGLTRILSSADSCDLEQVLPAAECCLGKYKGMCLMVTWAFLMVRGCDSQLRCSTPNCKATLPALPTFTRGANRFELLTYALHDEPLDSLACVDSG